MRLRRRALRKRIGRSSWGRTGSSPSRRWPSVSRQLTRLGAENFFPTIEQAVERYLAMQQVEWTEKG
jgi:hypothetical protein